MLCVDVHSLTSYQRAAQIIEQTGGLDICILNAGKLDFYDTANFKSQTVEDIMNTNFFGITRGIEVALPLLRQSSYGHLVGMSSLASYCGLPARYGAYCASKAAIRMMLESLRYDLQSDHISLSIINPGFVKTALSDQNNFAMPKRVSVKKAAEYIVSGIAHRQYNIDFPSWASMGIKGFAMMPGRMQTWLLKLLHTFEDNYHHDPR